MKRVLAVAVLCALFLSIAAIGASAKCWTGPSQNAYELTITVGNDGHDVRVCSDHRIIDMTIEYCDGSVEFFGKEIRGWDPGILGLEKVVYQVWVHMHRVTEDDGTGRGVNGTGPQGFC